jgi:protein lifeguard
VAEATIDIRNQFVRKVYAILTVQLIATGAVSALSWWSVGYKEWIQSHPSLVFGSVGHSLAFSFQPPSKSSSLYPEQIPRHRRCCSH